MQKIGNCRGFHRNRWKASLIYTGTSNIGHLFTICVISDIKTSILAVKVTYKTVYSQKWYRWYQFSLQVMLYHDSISCFLVLQSKQISEHISCPYSQLSWRTMNLPKHLFPSFHLTTIHCVGDHNVDHDGEKCLQSCFLPMRSKI